MNFDTNETQLMIAQSIKDFAEINIRPFIMEWDEAQTFPLLLFKQITVWLDELTLVYRGHKILTTIIFVYHKCILDLLVQRFNLGF